MSICIKIRRHDLVAEPEILCDHCKQSILDFGMGAVMWRPLHDRDLEHTAVIMAHKVNRQSIYCMEEIEKKAFNGDDPPLQWMELSDFVGRLMDQRV